MEGESLTLKRQSFTDFLWNLMNKLMNKLKKQWFTKIL